MSPPGGCPCTGSEGSPLAVDDDDDDAPVGLWATPPETARLRVTPDGVVHKSTGGPPHGRPSIVFRYVTLCLAAPAPPIQQSRRPAQPDPAGWRSRIPPLCRCQSDSSNRCLRRRGHQPVNPRIDRLLVLRLRRHRQLFVRRADQDPILVMHLHRAIPIVVQRNLGTPQRRAGTRGFYAVHRSTCPERQGLRQHPLLTPCQCRVQPILFTEPTVRNMISFSQSRCTH